MAFKLRNIKDVMSRKYGTGEYSRTDKSKKAAMKPGESKFQYDVRMRKEGGRKATKSKSKEVKTSWGTGDPDFHKQDPKSETNIGANIPSYDYQMQERNPGDLREQHRNTFSILPSAPGDEWAYTIDQDESGIPVLWAGKDDDWHEVEPGSKSDKAIRERYTGSETGSLENWEGHDRTRVTYREDEEGDIIDESWDEMDWKKSYLPYDLAQKKYNPNYKGSKK
jgi:hypothetical protein